MEKKDYILNLIENLVIAVCENFEEAEQAEKAWVSAVLLVFQRWWDPTDIEVFPIENDIKKSVWNLKIPVFIRVRYWHFWEADIAQSLWVSAILEAEMWSEYLKKSLNQNNYNIPIISEIYSIKDLKSSQKNYLLLWDYATWDLIKLVNSLKELRNGFNLKVFIWGWIWNPADIKVLAEIWWIRWYFIWTAMFDVEEFEIFSYTKEVISYIKAD